MQWVSRDGAVVARHNCLDLPKSGSGASPTPTRGLSLALLPDAHSRRRFRRTLGFGQVGDGDDRSFASRERSAAPEKLQANGAAEFSVHQREVSANDVSPLLGFIHHNGFPQVSFHGAKLRVRSNVLSGAPHPSGSVRQPAVSTNYTFSGIKPKRGIHSYFSKRIRPSGALEARAPASGVVRLRNTITLARRPPRETMRVY
jgi:hypothetical protein